jgi:hypothetical protein
MARGRMALYFLMEESLHAVAHLIRNILITQSAQGTYGTPIGIQKSGTICATLQMCLEASRRCRIHLPVHVVYNRVGNLLAGQICQRGRDVLWWCYFSHNRLLSHPIPSHSGGPSRIPKTPCISRSISVTFRCVRPMWGDTPQANRADRRCQGEVPTCHRLDATGVQKGARVFPCRCDFPL